MQNISHSVSQSSNTYVVSNTQMYKDCPVVIEQNY